MRPFSKVVLVIKNLFHEEWSIQKTRCIFNDLNLWKGVSPPRATIYFTIRFYDQMRNDFSSANVRRPSNVIYSYTFSDKNKYVDT